MIINMFTAEIGQYASIVSGIEMTTHKIVGGVEIPVIVAGERDNPRRRQLIAVDTEDLVPVMYSGSAVFTPTGRVKVNTRNPDPGGIILFLRGYPGDGDVEIRGEGFETLAEGSGQDEEGFYREWVIYSRWDDLYFRVERGSLSTSWTVKTFAGRVVILPTGEEDLI